jgi:hypothetical protein
VRRILRGHTPTTNDANSCFPLLRSGKALLALSATASDVTAAAAFEQEIANSPEHVPARLGIAAIKATTIRPERFRTPRQP